MSACISRHGEFSTHVNDADYVCTLCGVLDEAALIAELNRLRAEVVRLKADAIPDGGQWLTYYGDLAYLDDTYQRAEYTHQRHEWHGPVTPIEVTDG